MGMERRLMRLRRAALPLALLVGAAVALPGCRSRQREAAPEPFGPVRSIRDIRSQATELVGQVVRLRGRVTDVRDLNPGMPFPWDVVYTVEDETGTLPVHWFAQEPSPKERKPPTLAENSVIITGKVKLDVELEEKRYPLLIHELAELHNQERLQLPASPTAP
jgi:RecJ-like exonuclease